MCDSMVKDVMVRLRGRELEQKHLRGRRLGRVAWLLLGHPSGVLGCAVVVLEGDGETKGMELQQHSAVLITKCNHP